MKFKITFLFILNLALCLPAIAQKYNIDASHTSVTSSVQRFAAVNVIGRFNDVSGTINYDAADMSKTKADVIISVASYNANNVGGEAAVKSAAFLDADKFPEITFSSKSVTQNGDENIITGDLTIHGVTKEVSFPFVAVGPVLDMPTQKMSIAIIAELTVDRQEYGVSFDRKLPSGKSFIGDMVTINLNVLAVAE